MDKDFFPLTCGAVFPTRLLLVSSPSGHAAAPQEINNHHFDREGAYSHTLGYASGLNATVDQTESYYIATVGYNSSEGFSVGRLADVPAALVSIFERVMDGK